MVRIGEKYKHFKGNIYSIIELGKDCETTEDVVIYKNILDNQVWVRTLKDFTSLVDNKKYPNVKQKYRFELIKK